MKPRLAYVIALVAIASASAGWWARDFIAIDTCLDAGGRWETRGGFSDGGRWAGTEGH